MAKADGKKTLSIHAGRRERIRERLRREGLDSFSEHEVLELLLTYAIPRQDVNPLAHELINTFGSLSAVFNAQESELLRVKGMGRSAALLLSMMPGLMRYYQLNTLGERPVIITLADARTYCLPLFIGAPEEQIYMICLDKAGHVLHRSLLHKGIVDQVALHPRTVVETALRHNAHAVILAHNHPSGMCVPSAADMEVTAGVNSALYLIGISLVDHLIFAGSDAYSIIRRRRIESDAQSFSYVCNLHEGSALREDQYEWISIAPGFENR